MNYKEKKHEGYIYVKKIHIIHTKKQRGSVHLHWDELQRLRPTNKTTVLERSWPDRNQCTLMVKILKSHRSDIWDSAGFVGEVCRTVSMDLWCWMSWH